MSLFLVNLDSHQHTRLSVAAPYSMEYSDISRYMIEKHQLWWLDSDNEVTIASYLADLETRGINTGIEVETLNNISIPSKKIHYRL